MRKNACTEADDYSAFSLIQIRKYFQLRNIDYFVSAPEEDMVYALIHDAWNLLCRSGILRALTIEQKLAIFNRARIDFPLMHTELQNTFVQEPIVANFRYGKAYAKQIHPESACPCNSGLPYQTCCGRLKPLVETNFGS